MSKDFRYKKEYDEENLSLIRKYFGNKDKKNKKEKDNGQKDK